MTATRHTPEFGDLFGASVNPLARAAELIEEHGWCQGGFYDDQGRMCVDFALLMAEATSNERARRLLTDELRRRGDRERSVVEWNDAPGRTQLEVLAVLRAAATRWEGGAYR